MNPSAAPVSGHGRRIGAAISSLRDYIARGLVRLGVTPNGVTIFGFFLTCGAGWCLAYGAGQQVLYWRWGHTDGDASRWGLGAGIFLILSAACDMLDGAVARVGKLRSEVGAVLDSTLDRFSDIAIFLGIAWYFAWHGNLTYTVLAYVALCNTFLISYIKARAEDVIPDCTVGWWQRGERYVALLLGCFFGHMPAVLWQLSLSAGFTVIRRLEYAWRAVRAFEQGRPQPTQGPPAAWWGRLMLWYYPRRTWQHDVVAAFHISYIIFAPLFVPALRATGAYTDPLRAWLGG